MRTLILDGLFVYKDLENIFGSRNSLEIIYEKAKNNNFDRFILLNNGKITNIPEGIKNVELTDMTPFTILNAILSEARNSAEVAVFDAGNPLYDHDFIERMLEHHNKYIADYTYTIGYPEGLVPTILRKDVIKEMIKLVEDDEVIRKDYLFYTLSKDINSFDIETFLSPKDVRILRIKFGSNDIGEEIFTKMAFERFKDGFTADKLAGYYFDNPDVLYTVPYMLNLEITSRTPVKSVYYPETKEPVDMKVDRIKSVVSSMHEINRDFHLLLAGSGDPLVHPDFFGLMDFVLEKKIDCVIETTGFSVDEEFVEKMGKYDRQKTVFVVKLDCYDEKTYAMIHPGGDFSKAKNAIVLLKNAGFKAYTLVVRMHENEIEIERYIRNKEADDLIIRKYSTYCRRLPDRKVVDLSPLERIPCFHLRREVHVNPDETVTHCMFSGEIAGDLKTESLADVIGRLNECYVKNSKKEYLPFCVECDDYYLFNF
jgi:spiro-SPASM protein